MLDGLGRAARVSHNTTMLRLWKGRTLRLRARGRRFSSCGELGQPHPNKSYESRRDSWREGARREVDKEEGYRSLKKTNQTLIPALRSSVLPKRLSLSYGSIRLRKTQVENNRKKPMSTQSRRTKPAQQGPAVQDEDDPGCHEHGPTVQDEDGPDCHEQGPTVQDEDGPDCHEQGPTVQDEDGPDCHEQGPTVQDEDGLDCHEDVGPDQRRSPEAACWARRKHQQIIRRAEHRRKDQRGLQATFQDDGSEPIYLTNVAQGRGRFRRRHLLGAKIRLNDHRLVALIDSGCEVELVLSRNLADQLGVHYALISRDISLLDDTRMAAARTPTGSLDIAGSQKMLTAVVVDMVAFDCILGLPWLDSVNPVVNCNTRRLLLPGAEGPVEVDLDHNTCCSTVSDASLLSTAQILKIGRGGGPLYLATIRPTSREATSPTNEELSPSWKILVGQFDNVFPDDHSGLPPKRSVHLEINLEPGVTPASKAAYRLSTAEMDELKAQL
jgi:predicted aspartyl protease